MKKNVQTIFRTSFENELITSLELCHSWLGKVKVDPYQWKWAVIFFHNALQNLFIKELNEDIGLILKPGVSEDLLQSILTGAKMKKRWEMDYFLELFKKVGKVQRYTHSQAYSPTAVEVGCMKFLNHFRNKLIHLSDHATTEDVSLFPRIFLECILMAEFSLYRSGNMIWYEDGNEERAKSLIKSIRTKLKRLEKFYGLKVKGIPKEIVDVMQKL